MKYKKETIDKKEPFTVKLDNEVVKWVSLLIVFTLYGLSKLLIFMPLFFFVFLVIPAFFYVIPIGAYRFIFKGEAFISMLSISNFIKLTLLVIASSYIGRALSKVIIWKRKDFKI